MASDPELQARFALAYEAGPAALVALGNERGWQFSETEVSGAIERCLDDGELTDCELELIAGGDAGGCAPDVQKSNGMNRSPPAPGSGS